MLKDSKVMTEPERLKAAQWILKNSWNSYGIVHHRIIDEHNIWQATLMAMKMAVINLLAISPHKPQAILVDAMPLTLLDTNFATIPVHHFNKGESLSSSIAAASILAKVKRDAMMATLDPLLPGYSLGQHKGYSTATHQKAVLDLDRSIIHRQTFLKKLIKPQCMHDEPHEKQQTIC